MKIDGRPHLDCPACSEPLIPANGRGRYDTDGNYLEHRDDCRCPWCDWMWMDDEEPVTCACGAVVVVRVDDGNAAYTSELESKLTNVNTKEKGKT